jgi:hypothetical protein
MSTKSALRADLDAEDRKTLAEDRKRMERLLGSDEEKIHRPRRSTGAPGPDAKVYVDAWHFRLFGKP